MKRFIYEIYYLDEQYHTTEYWEAKNYREAKKQIIEAYDTEWYRKNAPCKITMIAEIKYEKSEYDD